MTTVVEPGWRTDTPTSGRCHEPDVALPNVVDVPLVRIAHPIIGEAEAQAVLRVMGTGLLAQGPEVEAFENEFSHLVGGRHCVAVNSGTAALHLGLLALGVGPGDEVVVPSFSFAASANAVALTGARPVFVDIDPRTYCLDPAAARAAVGPRTVAIVAVHLFGQPADMTALQALARRHGLALVEDAAQAHAASWNGTPVGALGDLAAFSFYPTKNMTSGEGGMVTSASADVRRAVRLLRNQGMERRYENEVVGFNARMTDLHAAIGRVQLQQLPAWTSTRAANAARLSASLQAAPGVTTPFVLPGASPVWHQYTVRIEGDRDGFADRLREHHGVESGVYYPTPIHRLPSYGLDLDLPVTSDAARSVLSLPVHPALTAEDLERVCAAVIATAEETS